MAEYNIWSVIVTAICGAYILWTAAALAVSYVKAKRLGILCVRFPTSVVRFAGAVLLSLLVWGSFAYFAVEYKQNSDYLNGLKTRGIIAAAERRNKTVDELLSGEEFIGELSYEDIYVDREIENYTKIVEQERIVVNSAAVGAVMVTLIVFSGCGAYITKSGGMALTGFKPLKTAAMIIDGRICFYNERGRGRVWTKLPASSENVKLFSGFLGI